MKQKDIAELPAELTCAHNRLEESGFTRQEPGPTAVGHAFDGVQLVLLLSANVRTSDMAGLTVPPAARVSSLQAKPV